MACGRRLLSCHRESREAQEDLLEGRPAGRAQVSVETGGHGITQGRWNGTCKGVGLMLSLDNDRQKRMLRKGMQKEN